MNPLIEPLEARFLLAIDFSKSTGNVHYDDGLGNTMNYRLFVPDGVAAGDKLPIILYLHGGGERGTDNMSQMGGGYPDNLFYATQGNFGSQYRGYLLAPQLTYGVQWVDYPFSQGSYTDAQEPPESLQMKLAMGILNYVKTNYQIDPSRIYVTGLSLGGYGTWDAIRRFPDVFAAAAPLSGGGNKDQGALLKNIPIWAYHGAQDNVVPISGTDDMNTAIKNAGGSMEYTRLDWWGHSGWDLFYDNATYQNSKGETFDKWLFAQHLNSGSIAGSVWNDSNSSGLKDAGENNLASWNIYLDANNNNIFEPGETITTTDAGGNYSFTNLATGTYHVKALLQSGYRKSQPAKGVAGYDVAINNNAATANFGVTTNLYLGGVVYNDVNSNGKKDAGESAIANAKIEIISGNTTIATRMTDANGAWQVQGLSAGSGEAKLTLPAGYSSTFPSSATYQGSMTFGEQNANLNFGLHAVSPIPATFAAAKILVDDFERLEFFDDVAGS